MAAVASGAHVLAGTLLTSLTAGVDFNIPDVNLDDPIFDQPPSTGPLYTTPTQITIDQLTTGAAGGSGVFDKLMVSLSAHLKVEYEQNRISGAEYTKAYTNIIQAALASSTQFLLAKDQAYWQALLVQAQARAAEAAAVQSRVELATARVNLARAQYEAATIEVNYGLTKLKIATEDATYDNMVKQGENLTTQTDNLVKQGTGIAFTNTNILPQQEKLLKEQVEVQRAQTSETRTDGVPVAGSVGKQKELYAQQIISYQRDAENKAAKIWADAYVTQMTVLDGINPPNQFNQENINEVMARLRLKVGFDT